MNCNCFALKKTCDRCNAAKITLVWRDVTWVGAEFTFGEYLEELGNPTGEEFQKAVQSFKKYLKKPVILKDSVEYSSAAPDTKDNESNHLALAMNKLRHMEKEKRNKKKKD